LGPTSQVGLYSAAASLATLSSIAPIALTALLTRKTAEQGTLHSWRRAHVPVLALTFSVAVAVAILGWFAIPVLLGEDFIPARSLLPILCAAAIPYGSCQIDAAACAGLRDLRTGALVSTIGCGALVVLAASGYQVLGPAGVACGVLATYVLMALVARIRLQRLTVGNGVA
jgi:O-antigen/teichoic acid export membrane protein